MWPNPQETADLITLTEKILNGKLYSLCSVGFAETLRQAQLIRCTHICSFDQIGKTMKKLQWIINAVKCFNNSQKWNVYSWIVKYLTNLGPIQASSMKLCVETVSKFNLNQLVILADRSILDAWLSPQYASAGGYNQ